MANQDATAAAPVPINVRTPDPFDFDKPESWTTWCKRFERFISVSGLASKPDKEKIDLLCYTMGEQSEDILTRVIADLNAATFNSVKTEFDKYFPPKKNVIFERLKFNSRVQKPDESADSFITSLHSLAERCDYGTLKNELIRDRIVIGLRDVRTSERMQLKPDLTLEEAVTMARQAEIQSKQSKLMRENDPEIIDVCKLNATRDSRPRGGHQRSQQWQPPHGQPGQWRERDKCTRCGLPRHDEGRRCPAVESQCRRCMKFGHWQRACRSKFVNQVENASTPDIGKKMAANISLVI